MNGVRVASLLLVFSLLGPSVGALVCDWACAANHTQSSAGTGCHEHGTKESSATVSAAHRCHDLAASVESILTSALQLDLKMIAMPVALPGSGAALTFARSRDRSLTSTRAPSPPLISLRL